MSRTVTVAAMQLSLSDDLKSNIAAVVDYAVSAAKMDANIVLPPELFQGLYFCKSQKAKFFKDAYSVSTHPAVRELCKIAKAYRIWIPASIFEKDGPHFYNSVAIISDDGKVVGVYRKSHIPDGPGYQEKYYFKPSTEGFKVWQTQYGVIGVGICWDQWFPECARAMALKGAEILLYPTASGSEPQDSSFDTRHMWRLAMQGHAVCNSLPVIASNRVGSEDGQVFYGASFIADHRGNIVQSMNDETGIIVHQFDLDMIAMERAAFGLFRDRRPEMYHDICR